MSELYVLTIQHEIWSQLSFFFGILAIACFATTWYLEKRDRTKERIDLKREVSKAYEKGYKEGFWFGTDRE